MIQHNQRILRKAIFHLTRVRDDQIDKNEPLRLLGHDSLTVSKLTKQYHEHCLCSTGNSIFLGAFKREKRPNFHFRIACQALSYNSLAQYPNGIEFSARFGVLKDAFNQGLRAELEIQTQFQSDGYGLDSKKECPSKAAAF